MVAILRKAFADGAHAKRGGISTDYRHDFYQGNRASQPDGALKAAWMGGYEHQRARPGQVVTADDFPVCFDMKALKGGLLRTNQVPVIERKNEMTTRTAKELKGLEAAYRTDVYDPYAAEAAANNQEPQPFDEAFAAHLAALDGAPVVDQPDVPAPEPTEPAKPVAAKPKKGEKPKKADKPAKEKKPRGFRASSEDRKTINAAAAAVAKKAKVESKVRCLPQDGQTYSDFLSGKVLKVDADGNGSVVLDVVPIKDSKAIGTITVTVKANVLTAK